MAHAGDPEGDAFMNKVVAGPLVQSGREAMSKNAWSEAYRLLKEADTAETLSADDLAALAEAAWWTGRIDDCIEARERAYNSFLKDGNPASAAMIALVLSHDYSGKLAHSISQGWFGRAERILATVSEAPAHGYLAWMRTHALMAVGDLDGALAQAEQVLELGTRFKDADLEGYGLLQKGRVLIGKGHVEEGLSLLDEATVAAVSGELSALASGIIYCLAITTTTQLADYSRSAQWTEAVKRWCDRQSISGFPGICRVHRAEIVRLRGAWAEAEQELRGALDELQNFNLEFVAEGFNEIGEIRLRMGDLAEAEEAFRQAHELGRLPEPGLSMLRLAQGKVRSAQTSIERAVRDETIDDIRRSRLLPAQVEIALAGGDNATARAAADKLETLVEVFGTPPLKAAALRARGEVLQAEGDLEAATECLRRSWRLWNQSDLPYEAARTRMLLGIALRAEGDEESARLEIEAAKSTFQRLGAVLDLRTAMELLGEEIAEGVPKATAPGARVTKTFMFTDIVKSTNLVDAIGDEAWESLLEWHDQTLRRSFSAHRGVEVNKVGDGFFVAFDTPCDAIECAVTVQRGLREHRKEHGFAPQVRVGLHLAEATQKSGDYGGKGVHAAARIGALAEGGEVLASRDVIDAAGLRLPIGEARSVSLKGVSEPVEVAPILSD
jgi:class 3 adenylate cyclase/Flp pilus assembly protein TadD